MRWSAACICSRASRVAPGFRRRGVRGAQRAWKTQARRAGGHEPSSVPLFPPHQAACCFAVSLMRPQAVFKVFDTEGSGQINRLEFKRGLEKLDFDIPRDQVQRR